MDLKTLSPIESKLHGIIMIEKINTTIVKKLITSDLLQVADFNNYFYETEKKQLQAYLIKDHKIEYRRAKGMNYGRVMPLGGCGLSQFRKTIRHTVCDGDFTDIDIVNCFPSIITQICTKYGVDCSFMNEYVNNRNKYLDEWMDYYGVSKDVAKKLPIILFNFGSFNGWLKQNKVTKKTGITIFIHNLIEETNKIGEWIIKNNNDLVEAVKKHKEGKSQWNVNGSVVSYYLQEIENRILESMYDHCVENKIITKNNGVLCCDGIMIKTKNYNDDLLNQFSDVVMNKFGLKLQFVVKPMDEGILSTILNERCDVSIDLMEDFDELNIKKIVVNQKYLTDVDGTIDIFELKKKVLRHKHVMIKSYTGSGKTCTMKALKTWGDDNECRVISIGSRRSLMSFHADKMDIAYYENAKADDFLEI